MATKMAETKIGVGNYFENNAFFTSILDDNIVLVNDNYACFIRKSTEIESFIKISFGLTTYLSQQTQWVVAKLMESGEVAKFKRLLVHLLSMKRSCSSTKCMAIHGYMHMPK